jgi:anti-anti-sigma factor
MSPQCSDQLVEVQVSDGVTVARLVRTNLDGSNAEAVAEELQRLARAAGGGPLRLDLGAVTFLSSTGLALLVSLHEQVRAAGGRLTLEGVGPEHYTLFRATGLASVLDVRPKEPPRP